MITEIEISNQWITLLEQRKLVLLFNGSDLPRYSNDSHVEGHQIVSTFIENRARIPVRNANSYGISLSYR